MKYVALLLAVMTGWLSTMPERADYCPASEDRLLLCCADNHCHADEPKQPSSEKASDGDGDCCPGGVCNPFQSCDTYSFLRTSPLRLPEPVTTFNNIEKVRFGLIDPISTFTADFFQPPEPKV